MPLSEFRQDLVSGEWVLISTERAKRPHDSQAATHAPQAIADCHFEDLTATQELIWKHPNGPDWRVAVIKNKFPAVHAGLCTPAQEVGPFTTHDAIGNHEVFVYRDHDKQLHQFTPQEMLPVIQAYKKRKKEIVDLGGCVEYVTIFHNFGVAAGASVWHPHSQLVATPILPPSVQRSIRGAYDFFQKQNKRVYDVMMAWEQEQGKRIVYENDSFLAYCPFASRHPGEIRIYPKNNQAHFKDISEELDRSVAEALSVVLGKMTRALGEPAFNFYIHTAPLETSLGDIHDYYSWHIEILPKLTTHAGFELGTGVDINPVDPDDIAAQLRAA